MLGKAEQVAVPRVPLTLPTLTPSTLGPLGEDLGTAEPSYTLSSLRLSPDTASNVCLANVSLSLVSVYNSWFYQSNPELTRTIQFISLLSLL